MVTPTKGTPLINVKVETLIFKDIFKNYVKNVYLLWLDTMRGPCSRQKSLRLFKLEANYVIVARFNFIHFIYGTISRLLISTQTNQMAQSSSETEDVPLVGATS